MTADKAEDEVRPGGRFRQILVWLLTGLIALILLLFAVSNTDNTALRFWPLPFVLAAPLYLVSLILLIGGFLLGHFIGWLGQRRWRQAARRGEKRVLALEQELATYRQMETARLQTLPVSRALPVR